MVLWWLLYDSGGLVVPSGARQTQLRLELSLDKPCAPCVLTRGRQDFVGKCGPRNFDAKTLEEIRQTFIKLSGNCTETGLQFGAHRHTIESLRDKHDWLKDIPEIEAETRRIANRSVAEANAKIIKGIDLYIDKQLKHIEKGLIKGHEKELPGYDVRGVSDATKTRQLLTGGATDRPDYSNLTRPELLERIEATKERIAKLRDDD
jgi:hypothetical protein